MKKSLFWGLNGRYRIKIKIFMLATFLLYGAFTDNFYCGEKREIVSAIRDFETASKNGDANLLNELLANTFGVVKYSATNNETSSVLYNRAEYISLCETNPMPSNYVLLINSIFLDQVDEHDSAGADININNLNNYNDYLVRNIDLEKISGNWIITQLRIYNESLSELW